jgi:CheY-like chemotaxis protein
MIGAANPALTGKCILAVEDEAMLAMALEDMLADLGAIVLGPVSSIAKAAALLRSDSRPVHAAVLDIHLGTEFAYPVAEELTKRGVPFMFLTGYGQAGLEAPYGNVPTLVKPIDQGSLGRMLSELLGSGRKVHPTE